MTVSAAVGKLDEQKLEALRRLDQFRRWDSLDEKRYCLVCGKIITGAHIQVAGGTRTNAALQLSCPTEGCNSIPMDWVLPTNEMLVNVEKLAAEESEGSQMSSAAGGGERNTVRLDEKQQHFVSRLRRLGLLLRRRS